MLKVYKCEKCGQMVVELKGTACTPFCCGQAMTLLEPNTVDAAQEKHVPAVDAAGSTVTVKVGTVEHPMTDDHYIAQIFLETEQGWQVKNLKPGEKPEAVFEVTAGDKAVAAYEYCTKHGFWKAEL